jgi:2,3-bisphosphoglycerate-dependent phosphoglycerate mutase
VLLRHTQRPFTRPPDATELLLVRHGASASVPAGETPAFVGGHTDVPLSPRGREQAQALAAALEGVPIDGLFITTLRRTAETAAPLAEACGLRPVVVPELREVFLGEWEGGVFAQRAADGDPLLAEALERQRWDVIPGAEPDDAFAARVRDGLEHVAGLVGPDRAAVVVTHGGVIAEACRQATGSEPFAFLNVQNAAISRLVRTAAGRWVLLSYNDTAHLAGLEASTSAPPAGALSGAGPRDAPANPARRGA